MTASSRRAFIRGQWNPLHPTTDRDDPDTTEIVSLVVSARPENLYTVEAAIAQMPGTEVHARSPIGKLVVVIVAPTQGEVGATANAISLLPHVISAAMVFQATDVGTA